MPANTNHPAFAQPVDSSISIWRYMDFAKYVSLLKAGAIHFARVDTLEDPFEGSLSKAEYERLEAVAKDGEAKGDIPIDWKGRYFDVLMGVHRRAPKENYVSCWHMNSSESEAMWQLYASSGYAVAIKSTYDRLASSLPSIYKAAEYIGPFIGVVKYADHHVDDLPSGNSFHALMHKRLSFEHEQECRAVVWHVPPEVLLEPFHNDKIAMYPSGIVIPAPLEDLIEIVVVSPLAPAWFTETVTDLTAKYGYNFSIQKSALLDAPFL